MSTHRTERPRPMGLLTRSESGSRVPERRAFPYAAGDRIAGDLTVIGHLAVGRLGHLYQVWSASEWCAYTCKILSPELRGERRAASALRREARVLRRLSHPNVIRGFDQGEHDGLPFLLMEYVDGPSIFDLLERQRDRRLPVADAIRTAMHIGAGLYHLHRHGFLHLDLKPANLLLRGSVPVLVDFDSARPIAPGRRPIKPTGTAPYMAPEQVRREPLRPATDVYGLGAVLYEMLTGRWAYEDVFTGREKRHGEERDFPQLGPVPPASMREYREEISPELDTLVLECLATEPGARPATLHPVLRRLADLLPEPVAFWPEGVTTERRREPRD